MYVVLIFWGSIGGDVFEAGSVSDRYKVRIVRSGVFEFTLPRAYIAHMYHAVGSISGSNDVFCRTISSLHCVMSSIWICALKSERVS